MVSSSSDGLTLNRSPQDEPSFCNVIDSIKR